jgi:tetratricopeptide (TPR) repeat protein
MTELYGAAFDRVAAALGEHVDRVLCESREAPVLLGELLLLPRERRLERVRSEPRLWLLKLCERLEAASRKAWAEDPATAVEMAELAVEVAERLDPRCYGETLVGDARALAWAYVGNARRIASDLNRAEEALGHAEQLYRQFEADLLTEAEILVFQASLRNTQGRFAEASALLDHALWLYREAGDTHQEGRTLILKGMVLGDGGDFEAAVASLAEGLPRIDPAVEPRLLLVAHHNLSWYLCDHGKHEEAAEALQRSRRLYLELGDRMDLVRLRWLEGRIALGQGRPAEAVRVLGLARDVFLEQEIGFDAALISLDLAMAHARQGDTEGVKRIISEIGPVFQACRVHPERLASLLLLRDASQSAQAEAVLDRLSVGLRRARSNPES